MGLMLLRVATHLLVAGYSLMSARSLDGSRLGERRPLVGAILALAVAAAATSFTLGAL